MLIKFGMNEMFDIFVILLDSNPNIKIILVQHTFARFVWLQILNE